LTSNTLPPLNRWEAQWSPYDEATYTSVLNVLQPDDVVLDIGAGDLRLAYRMAAQVAHVYAIEINPTVLAASPQPPPANLSLLIGDARQLAWPSHISTAVLLMRHCTHVQLYSRRLQALGCKRLISNARWRLGVEVISLTQAQPWATVKIGWYACWCGATGFVSGPAQNLTPNLLDYIHQVSHCPACQY
jgi:hypothetical protein